MTDSRNSDEGPTELQGGGLSLADVWYVLFKHKGKIAFFVVAALIVAGAVVALTRPVFNSEAKLLIRYVLDNQSPALNPGKEPQVMRPDAGGAGLINTEIEILTSLDLAREVAEKIGPEKLLGKGADSNALDQAAALIGKNLTVHPPGKGNVISIVFQHSNPKLIQPVLRQLIDNYKQKHREIHEAAGILDSFLLQQTEQFRTNLVQTEEELKKIKNKAGIVSLDDTKKQYTEWQSKTRQDLFSSEAELEERKAALKQAEKLTLTSPGAASDLGASLEKINRYKRVCRELQNLRNKEDELLLKYTEQHPSVVGIHQQIEFAEAEKKKMEQEIPGLSSLAPLPLPGTTNAPAISTAADIARIPALEAKIKVLTNQLERIGNEIVDLNAAESAIADLQRKKDSAATNFKRYSDSVEQAHINEALGSGKITNIYEVQSPSPPLRVSSKLKKTVGMIMMLGFLGGIGLAFLIELVFDQSVRRSCEVETRLNIPLFASIPDTEWSKHSRALPHRTNGDHRKLIGDAPGTELESTGTEIATWDPQHSLHPYYESLRDRLLTYFEIKKMTHKPKLVGVTSCSRGAGVTTMASGLAASLSETGDGNVLLVDLNLGQGAAHPFYKGKPGCALPEIFEQDKRDAALVQENLYMVSAHDNDRLPRLLPKRFADLVPKFKASDYDYIIFDLPPITATSMTPRLAGFMDMVLLVVESEKTNREVVKQSSALLANTNRNVSAILNKTRNYLPKWLHQEL